ncbi:nucleotidyl transferase AbiEii/AbiGii toxin family protein [uncultured Psychrosphaera sp.]|uniref:nucleotidyl transferase AbiEii/AbiGii toxin family protein n=1 Tax=uncultured Psychrosphaera sp. TaxID=1403522 RepID=UPI002602FCBB|nr:nucleotidyl transferase AbiEii/AbiGii toxin family protein [uncultured Psychrosphaera sp.]
MLKHYISQIVAENPDYAGITSVIEKEILHHDIMHILVEQGVLQKLTFIGGTALRLCYNSSRLSEDLDFNAGHDFKHEQLDGLEEEIKKYLSKKYEVDVFVNKPSGLRQGNTASWNISIERESGRPDIPRQKMHIDVCAIPSFDIVKKPLVNHYGIDVATQGYLIPVQTLDEIMVDKFIALAYRSRRIKPRDLWDIVWLKQQSATMNFELLNKKLGARSKSKNEFEAHLQEQVLKLNSDNEVKADFISEMSRFVPLKIKQRTLDNPDYWPYLQSEVSTLAKQIMEKENKGNNPFDMS